MTISYVHDVINQDIPEISNMDRAGNEKVPGKQTKCLTLSPTLLKLSKSHQRLIISKNAALSDCAIALAYL